MGKVKVMAKPTKPKSINKIGKFKKAKTAKKLKSIWGNKLFEIENFDSESEESESELKEEFELASPVVKSDDEEVELSLLDESKVSDVDTHHVGNLVLAPKLVDFDQIKDGIIAFMKYFKKTENAEVKLFEEASPIFLQVTSMKVPKTPNRQAHFTLKHSLFNQDSEICLIVKDGDNKKEYEETIEHYQNLLQSKGVTNVKEIMTSHQLKSEYGQQFELKRKLIGLYDCFLVDGSVCGFVTHILGKIFYEKRKMPQVVNLKASNLKGHFEHVLSKTSMKIHSKSDLFSVQVGGTNMTCEELYDNVIEVIDQLNAEFPGGFDNVRFLGIKTDKSVTIPLYLTLRHINNMKTPTVKSPRPKNYKSVSGELTTYANRTVTVLPSGRVLVRDAKKSPKVKKESDDNEEAEVGSPVKKLKKEKGLKVETVEDDEVEADESEDELEEEAEEKYFEGLEKKQKVTHPKKLKKEKAMKVETDEEEVEGEEDELEKAEEMYLEEYQHEQKKLQRKRKNSGGAVKPKQVKVQNKKKAKKEVVNKSQSLTPQKKPKVKQEIEKPVKKIKEENSEKYPVDVKKQKLDKGKIKAKTTNSLLKKQTEIEKSKKKLRK